MNGYLIVPSKLVSYVAITLTFTHYAIVSTLIAIAIQASVLGCIAVAPTLLPARAAMALLVAFLPVGSEVYALPLYTIWWTVLLIFVGLLWRSDRGIVARVSGIVIAAVSTPFIVIAAPIFALRAVVERTRGNIIACVVALAMAAVQGTLIATSHVDGAPPLDALQKLPTLISAYFGTSLYSLGQHGAGALGAAVLALLVIGSVALPRPDRLCYGLLGLCLVAAIMASVLRVKVDAPHPMLAGPRYFFLPLILTGWMLITLAARAHRVVALAAMAVAGSYLPSFAADFLFEPQVPKQPWGEQAAACAAAPADYTFDIQYGLANVRWSVTVHGDDCRRLASRALFDNALSK